MWTRCPLPSPSSLLSGQKRLGQNKKIVNEEQGAPPDQVRPNGGWIILVWLGKGYFERVPEHLRAMSVMPKRATWPP